MNKQERYDRAYLKMAMDWGELSHCTRKQVGAIIVRNNQIISDGFNGTPSGFDNCCEDENGDTKWEVMHAEFNAIMKCAKFGDSCDGATMYQTYSPCKECSKLIIASGIKRVVFNKQYKDTSGVDFLQDAGLQIEILE